MVFSIETIKQSKNNSLLKESTNEEISFDRDSLFEKSLEYILDEDMQFSYMISSAVAINEGMFSQAATTFVKNQIKKIDIRAILEKIFQWFIDTIEALGRAFKVFLLNFVNRSYQIKKYKDEVLKFKGKVKYFKPYYDYRNLDISTSYTSYEVEFENEYNSFISDLSRLRTCRTNNDIYDIMDYINSKADSMEYDLSELRGRMLGMRKSIPEESFADELFIYFRGAEEIDPNKGLFIKYTLLDTNRIRDAVNGIDRYKNQEILLKKEIDKVKFESKKQRSNIRSVDLDYYIPDNIEIDKQITMIYNNIVSTKCKKIKAICNMYCMFFGAKLEALKEYNMLNREICLSVIKEVVKEES